MREVDMPRTLNDYLWGKCTIEEAAYEVFQSRNGGQVFLVPSSINPNDIARVLREKYDASDMHNAFRNHQQRAKPGLSSDLTPILGLMKRRCFLSPFPTA